MAFTDRQALQAFKVFVTFTPLAAIFLVNKSVILDNFLITAAFIVVLCRVIYLSWHFDKLGVLNSLQYLKMAQVVAVLTLLILFACGFISYISEPIITYVLAFLFLLAMFFSWQNLSYRLKNNILVDSTSKLPLMGVFIGALGGGFMQRILGEEGFVISMLFLLSICTGAMFNAFYIKHLMVKNEESRGQ